MIIKSLLDSDYYKFTMLQTVLHNYPGTTSKFKFKCRGDGLQINENFLKDLNLQLDELCTLRFNREEILYLSNIDYFKIDFIEFLRLFQFNRNYIKAYIKDGILEIEIFGPWISTILFEVPVLAIVNEINSNYTINFENNKFYDEGMLRLNTKINIINNPILDDLSFADFGTRRRFNYKWHDIVIDTLTKKCKRFVGTSNVYFAMKYGIKPIGTMAHEFLQAFQQLGPRLIDSQKEALDLWIKEYRGSLGIALSDVVGFDAFLKDFDLYFAKLYDGCRHDSGDPIVWCNKLIKHYENLGIDPRTKTAVFSDGLTFTKIIELFHKFNSKIKTSFGIGTNLTNDVGLKPIQIVIKMTECNGKPVAKLSDSVGKEMCEDENFVKYLRLVFNIKSGGEL